MQTKFNETEARRRSNREDPQVQIAAEILRQATDPMSVFAIGERVAARLDSVEQAAAGTE